MKKIKQKLSATWEILSTAEYVEELGRDVNGDPQYFDNWRDIAGYATLAERACEAVRGGND